MQSDLSQLGGFARASVIELSRSGFRFDGVRNGVVRMTPPAGGEPIEFTNDAYLSAHVAAPVRDDASNDDSSFSESLGGADFSPVYDSTTAADDAPAVNAPEWDADAEIIAALEQYHAPAETPELGFDADTAARIGAVAESIGLDSEDLERIADRFLATPGSHADRLPLDIATRIEVLVTRRNGRRIAEARLVAVRRERVLKTLSLKHEIAPSVRVQIAEAAAVAEALQMLRTSADVVIVSTCDLSPEARPVLRGSRSVWNALEDAEKAHNVTWHCRRKTAR